MTYGQPPKPPHRVMVGARNHPGREPSDPPIESAQDTKSQAAQVAEFRTGRFAMRLPAVVITAVLTAASGAIVAWINKPAPPPVSALTKEQDEALRRCGNIAQDVAELKVTVRWIEPQIGILLARTDQRPAQGH